MQTGVGIETELLSHEALLEIMPGLDTGDLLASAYEPESGYADAYLTVNAYADAARRLGATVFLKTKVERIRFKGGG